MTNKELEKFFLKVENFQKKQEKQKQRGINDYNLLTTVLPAHDEVRLHSRMIASLLNPRGVHYQNTFFIEKFFEVLKLPDFELDFKNADVRIEYHDIDLFITDGINHIILENKIWAEDQPCQIIKYINIIKEEYKLDTVDNIRVLYLTAQNKEYPSGHKVENDYISIENEEDLKKCSKRENTKKLVQNGLKNYKVEFKKITYKKEILQWLQESLNEIQNITNLNESLKQYIDVVKIVSNQYEGKIMTLSDELLKDESKMRLAKEVSNAYQEAIDKQKKSFVDNLFDGLQKRGKVTHTKNWHCLDIEKDPFLIRFTLEDTSQIHIQITNKDKPFQRIDKEKKKMIFSQLKKIDKNLEFGWDKVYGLIKFDYNNSSIDESITLLKKIGE